MKRIIIFIIIFSILVLVNQKKVNSKQITIPNEAIRLRVLANSNNEYDQKIKMKLSIELESKVQGLLQDVNNIKEARKIIENNIDELNKYISGVLKKEKYNGSYKLTFGEIFFPEKKYNGIIYEKGYYESVLVTLGEGKGNNWWCVLFPPLCLMEAEENNTGDIEYKFFVKELLNKYF